MKQKKILITGACGFIGSHLTERLVELGAQVRAMVYYNSFNNWGWVDTFTKEKIKKIDVLPGDIRCSQTIQDAMKGIDYVPI